MTKIRLTNRKAYSVNGSSDGSPSESDPPAPLLHNNNNANNRRTLHQTSNDEYIDSQFQKPPAQIPIRSICLASFLCFAGISLLAFGFLVMSGHLDVKFTDRVWPMVIMGFLMFIPGAYHVRIAYYAYKGTPGYSFDDIPEFE